MSAFYDDMAQVAKDMLTEFGAAVVLTRTTPGAYNPETGTTAAATTATYNGMGAKFDYELKEIDGTKILQGDQKLYLSPYLMANPVPGDMIRADGADYTVISSKALRPAETHVLFEVQLRGVAA